MRKSSSLTVTDQFCGAGGSSLGATAAGAQVVLAMNHWKLAVETHNTNFPNTLHDCTDISACDPRRYPHTDILITSPECVNHSRAQGRKRTQQAQLHLWELPTIDPAAERSRATMLDVPRFAEYHQYECIIVENVVEAREWILFDEWLLMMQKLGYAWETVYFNSMFAHPTPQSRDRMYVVFWKKGNTAPDLRFTPLAWCAHCGKDVASIQSWKNPLKRSGRYGKQYVYCCPDCAGVIVPYYYAAANAINWQLPIQRIGERRKPLKPKTLRRVQLGIDRFASSPVLIELAHTSATSGMVQSSGLVSPFVLGLDHMQATGNYAHSVGEPWSTQTGRQEKALVVPYLIELYGGTARARTESLSTVTAQGNHHGLVVSPFAMNPNHLQATRDTSTAVPYLIDFTGQEPRARSVADPLATVVAGGNHHGLVVSPPVSSSFLVSYYGQDAVRSTLDPLGTQTTLDRHALVTTTEQPAVEECSFRMLQPAEIGRAMAFPETYVVLGNNRQKTKLYGNAVTPPVMQMILERCVATFQGR
jgi:DNA (cytosine-5)-methyltransferase 1